MRTRLAKVVAAARCDRNLTRRRKRLSRAATFQATLLLLLGVVAASACRANAEGPSGQRAAKGLRTVHMSNTVYAKPTDEQLRRTLTPMQYEVTQREATEPPFRNAYWDHHGVGLYVDVATGEPLFSSTDKFESGTGWPSFSRPVEPARVVERVDRSFGSVRTEVRSQGGASHLGHVFDDGPPPTGLRFCINSAAIRFVPAEKLEAEGYGAYRGLFTSVAPPAAVKRPTAAAVARAETAMLVTTTGSADTSKSAKLETAVLAGGCFWGMEDLLRKIPGVVETQVGYAGGKTAAPTYSDVKTGMTGHAEAVRVVFDPQKLSYADLLEKWFFRMHDPTTPNRQGNDRGTQYRSAIFATSSEQAKVAAAVKARVGRSGKWKQPLVTEIAAAGVFTRAEDYHQKYLEKNPGGYTCHFLRD